MKVIVNLIPYFSIYHVLFFLFQDFAIKIIKNTHIFWKDLISQKTDAGELNW